MSDILLLRELLQLLTFAAKSLLELRVFLAEEAPSLARLLTDKVLHLASRSLKGLDDLVAAVLAPFGSLLDVLPSRKDELLGLLSVSVDELLELVKALVNGVRSSRNGGRVCLGDRFRELDRFLAGRSRFEDLVLRIRGSIGDRTGSRYRLCGSRVVVVAVPGGDAVRR